MTPFVSIVIPCFNRHALLREALQSCCDNATPDTEVIVVDDGSDPPLGHIVREFNNARHIRLPSNMGQCAAKAIGASEAKGRFVQYLDSDDLLAPRKLELQIKQLETEDLDFSIASEAEFDNSSVDLVWRPRRTTLHHGNLLLGFLIACPQTGAVLWRRDRIGFFMRQDRQFDPASEVWLFLNHALFARSGAYCEDAYTLLRNHIGERASVAAKEADVPDALVRVCGALAGILLEFHARLREMSRLSNELDQAISRTMALSLTRIAALGRYHGGYQSATRVVDDKEACIVPKGVGMLSRLIGLHQALVVASAVRRASGGVL